MTIDINRWKSMLILLDALDEEERYELLDYALNQYCEWISTEEHTDIQRCDSDDESGVPQWKLEKRAFDLLARRNILTIFCSPQYRYIKMLSVPDETALTWNFEDIEIDDVCSESE